MRIQREKPQKNRTVKEPIDYGVTEDQFLAVLGKAAKPIEKNELLPVLWVGVTKDYK